MMNINLKELLDKIYELEGLVHLALKRDDNSHDILRLISKKGEEVSSQCLSLYSGKETNPSHTYPYQGHLPNDLPKNNLTKNNLLVDNKDDDFQFVEYSIDDIGNDAEEESSGISGALKDKNVFFGEMQAEDEEPTEEPSPSLSKQENKRGRLVFSINERFRFRKELFHDSDADFNNTLALVASMEDYDEAEDYFLNEENFDSTNPVVREFLGMIKKYFQ